ncbi:MAG TPA: tetratricopeptide repeat protein [Coleofasciculaceae cyanobacterium]
MAQSATDWYTLKAGGKAIGSIEIKRSRQEQGGRPVHVTEVSNVNYFSRAGSPFEMNTLSRFVEAPEGGRPLQFSYRYDLGEQRLLQAEGKLEGDTLDLRMFRDSEAYAGKAPVVENQFMFPGGPGIDKMYQQHFSDKPGSRFCFQTLSLGVRPEIVNTEVTLIGQETLSLSGKKPLRKFEVRNPVNRDSTVYEWRDVKGKLYKAHSVGSDMEMVYASRQEVRRLNQGGQSTVDLVSNSAVISNLIPQSRMTTEALYRIAPLTGQSINWRQAIPVGDRQRVIDPGSTPLERSDQTDQADQGDVLFLKVFQREPADSSVLFPIQFDKNYLQATPYMQVTDATIERTAEEIIGTEKRAYFAARMLQQWVYKNIDQKDLSLGFASAKETMQRRQGDCTEHAVLLAALARSLGIPSRVAVGLIYLPQGNEALGRFVYHMWTEVYIGNMEHGEWVPLDATNPEALPDATHIKVADSPLTDVNDLMGLTERVVGLMGKIKIDVLKAMALAQSVLSVSKQPGSLTVEIPKLDLDEIDIKSLSRKAIKRYRVEAPPISLSQDTAEGLFTYGVERLTRAEDPAQYSQAVSAFRKAIGKLRQPLEYYRMGERLASIEMYPLAREAFKSAMQTDGSLSPMVESYISGYFPAKTLSESQNQTFMHGISLQIDNRNPMGAAAVFQELTREAPDFAPAYRHLGEVTNGSEAISALSHAVTLAPNDYRNADSLGDALMAQNRYVLAAKAYRKAYETLKGQSFAQSKPWQEEIEGKLKLASGAAMLAGNKSSVSGWLETGKGLLRQNRLDEAIKAFSNATRLQPTATDAQVHLFLAHLRNSDWEALEASKGRIGSLSAGNPLAARLLGQHQIRTRQYPQAIRTLQRAISMEPGNRDGYLTLSTAYHRLAEQAETAQAAGKPSKSLPVYRKQAEDALKQGLNRVRDPWGKQALELQLAKLLLTHAKATEAQPLAEAVIAENPLSAQAYLLCGKAQYYQGDYSAAEATLKTARLLNPNDAEVLTLLGHVALEMGKEALALDFYQKAYKADPGSVESALSLRNLIAKMGVAAKKPPAYLELTNDEHDYLNLVLFWEKKKQQNYLEYLRSYSRYLDLKTLVSVQGIEATQTFASELSHIYDQALAFYNKLKDLQPPPRYRTYHYLNMYSTLKLLEVYQHIINDIGWRTPKEFENSNKEFNRLTAELNALDERENRELSVIVKNYPPPILAGMSIESNLDQTISSLENEETRLLGEIKTKKDEHAKSKTKGTTGSAGQLQAPPPANAASSSLAPSAQPR